MRSTAKYLLLLILATAFYDWKLVLTRQFTMLVGHESVSYVYAWLHFWVNSIRQGQLPLWDPYGFCGRPFAGEMLPSAFYPIHLLLLLVPSGHLGLISENTYNYIFVVSRLLCLFFTFALIRELGLSRFAAFIGACCFTFTGLIGQMPWSTFVEAATWLPLIFLFLLRALRAVSSGAAVRQASLSGLCLGLSILTGGMHFSMMQGLFALAAVVYWGANGSAPDSVTRRQHWRRMGVICAVFFGVAAGIGAVQLLPEFEYAKLSLRFIDGGVWPSDKKIPYDRLHPGMWPQSLMKVLIPLANVKNSGGEEWISYIGILPLFLAITAMWKRWQHVWVRYLTGVAVFSFVYSLGEWSPLHGWLYAVVPYLWTIRESGRFIYLMTFALALLAAIGAEYMLGEQAQFENWDKAKQILKWLAIVCAAVLFIPATFHQIGGDMWVSYSLILTIAGCGFFYNLTQKRADATTRLLMALFIFLDVSSFHWSPQNKSDQSQAAFKQMESFAGVAHFVKSLPEPGRVSFGFYPQPNLGDTYDVQVIAGGGGTALTTYSWLTSKRPDLLNGRYVIRPASDTQPGPIYQDKDWKLYIDPNVYPRAWVVHKVEDFHSEEELWERLGDRTIDFHQIALIEAPLRQALSPAAGTGEQARVTNYEPNRVSLDVMSNGSSLLVLSEMHYPGWHATVNGNESPILRVDGGLRGIVVPGGSSHVELRYVPIRIYIGGVIGLLTLAAVLGLWIAHWRQIRVTRQDARELKVASV